MRTDPTGHKWDDCEGLSGYRCKTHMEHAGIAKTEACERGGFCELPNGAVVDTTHYADVLAGDFWKKLLKAFENGKPTFKYSFTQPAKKFGVGGDFTVTFVFNLTQIKDKSQLAQVGAGAWWNYQFLFEMWEGTIFGGAKQSAFKNEDIPTTFIAYAAAVNGWDFNTAIEKAGGGPAFASGPVDGIFPSTPSCVYDGLCDGSTSRNNSIYLKVQMSDGQWSLLGYSSDFPVPLTDSKYFQYGGCVSNASFTTSNFGCSSP
jgi:hypothetical protein